MAQQLLYPILRKFAKIITIDCPTIQYNHWVTAKKAKKVQDNRDVPIGYPNQWADLRTMKLS